MDLGGASQVLREEYRGQGSTLLGDSSVLMAEDLTVWSLHLAVNSSLFSHAIHFIQMPRTMVFGTQTNHLHRPLPGTDK